MRSCRYRNCRLGDFLKELDLTEGRSTGVPTIQEKLVANGSPRATFETTDDRLTFLINIPVHPGCDNKLLQLDAQGQVSVPEGVQKSTQKGTQKSTQKILELIAENPKVTTQEMADSLGIIRRAVAKHIKKLQEQGVIRRVGPDKGGHWEVIERP